MAGDALFLRVPRISPDVLSIMPNKSDLCLPYEVATDISGMMEYLLCMELRQFGTVT